MATMIDGQLARVRDEAARHQVDPVRLVVGLIAYLAWGAAWLTRKAWVLLWRGVGFVVAAARLGWRDAAPGAPKQRRQ